MKKQLVSIIRLFAGITMISALIAATPSGWLTNLEQGMQDAKKEGKLVMVEFTGSDWCPPCIAMNKKVFSKKEFFAEAGKNYKLVELDFPNKNPKLREINMPLAEKYNIEGFPTILILDPQGRELSRFFASKYPSIEKFLAKLQEVHKNQVALK